MLLLIAPGLLDADEVASPVGSDPSTPPATFVRSINPSIWRPSSTDARNRRLLQAYHRSLVKWDDVLLARFQSVPGRPEMGYYGGGGHEENDIRPIAYAAMVNAFLARVPPSAGGWPAMRVERMRADARAALRYLVQGHVTGDGACLNGKRWGNQWQSAMWTRAAGLAGWFVWEDLDPGLRDGLARLVEFEADRFLRLAPKNSRAGDTGAEENAWNAQILSLACNLMPGHPRAPSWAEAANLWMYNALSVAADATDPRPGDGGRAIASWVRTTNALPDFTVENHGLVHVGYLKTTISMLLEGALPYLLTGVPVPQACQHHTAEGFEVVLRCMGWDAAPIYFSGSDWKIVQTQPTDVMQYAFMSLLAGNRQAAYLEAAALERTARLQQVEAGYYNVRRDLLSAGMAATRMVAAWLTHAQLGSGAEPVSAAGFNRHISGVTLLEHGQVLLHRTPTKFASFSWGPKRMALALPTDGSAIVWPHFASYVGLINDQDAAAPRAKVCAVRHEQRPDGFTVMAVLDRFNGAVEQCVLFTSLPGNVTVYVERLKVAKDFPMQTRETGIVGLEYDLGRNERTLFTRLGKLKTQGLGGEPAVRTLESDWLNIADRLGHVVRRHPSPANVMRHHDEAAGSGRVPKLQEWISLIGDAPTATAIPAEDWACVVTFLNQKHRDTARSARHVQFTVAGPRAVCRIGADTLRLDFAQLAFELNAGR